MLLNPSRSFTLMGVLNVTPDSFSDGGRYLDTGAALRHGLQMAEEGADWIDVGGESTRPGADPVGAEEEMRRVGPVVEALVKGGAAVSIDTYRPSTARRALDLGAALVNDITALDDAEMAPLVAERGAALVIMHMRGTPKTMQERPEYADIVREVRAFLEERVARAAAAGVSKERIAVDPGIGFGKKLEHNLALLRGLPDLAGLSAGILVGASRKSFLGLLTGAPAGERLAGSLAAALLAYERGARLFRVHDVRATREVLSVAEAVGTHAPPGPSKPD